MIFLIYNPSLKVREHKLLYLEKSRTNNQAEKVPEQFQERNFIRDFESLC